MKTIFSTLVLIFLFFTSLSAQQGFRAEIGIGTTVGDISELHSYTLQGNLYYLWDVAKNIDFGFTSGALVFLGNASADSCDGCFFDDYEAELHIPIALASRVNLSNRFSLGLDTGYALYIHIFDSGGGFYFRPVIAYHIKNKIALTASYANIYSSGYSSSSINIGVNFGF